MPAATLLTPAALDRLQQALCGQYDIEICPQLTLLIRSLAGAAVVCGVVADGRAWLIVDREKPNAMAHARHFLRECGAALALGVPDPFGLPIAEPGPDARCRLRLEGSPADGVPVPRGG